jgi:hypothetical protein
MAGKACFMIFTEASSESERQFLRNFLNYFLPQSPAKADFFCFDPLKLPFDPNFFLFFGNNRFFQFFHIQGSNLYFFFRPTPAAASFCP